MNVPRYTDVGIVDHCGSRWELYRPRELAILATGSIVGTTRDRQSERIGNIEREMRSVPLAFVCYSDRRRKARGGGPFQMTTKEPRRLRNVSFTRHLLALGHFYQAVWPSATKSKNLNNSRIFLLLIFFSTNVYFYDLKNRGNNIF